MKNYSDLLQLFYMNSEIPVCLLNEGEINGVFPSLDTPLFQKNLIMHFLDDERMKEAGFLRPVVYEQPPGFYLAFIRITEQLVSVIGPAFTYPLDQEASREHLSLSLYDGCREAFFMVLCGTPNTTLFRFIHSMELLVYLIKGEMVDFKYLYADITSSARKMNAREFAGIHYQRKEATFSHTPESYEMELSMCVEKGNIERARDLLMTPLTGQLGVLSLNEERERRYIFVTSAAVFARAAMRGGLGYETACSMADAYCQKMDLLRGMEQIDALTYQMILDFTEKVREIYSYKTHDVQIRKCIDYIQQHLHYPVTVMELSKVCSLSRNRLAERFFKETGMTVNEYVNREKMEEAIGLMEHTDMTLNEIAFSLGYSSQSHFNMVFRRFFQTTPKKYIDEITKKRDNVKG